MLLITRPIFRIDLPSVWYPWLLKKIQIWQPFRLRVGKYSQRLWDPVLLAPALSQMAEELDVSPVHLDARAASMRGGLPTDPGAWATSWETKEEPTPNQLDFLSSSAATTVWGLGQTGVNKLLSPLKINAINLMLPASCMEGSSWCLHLHLMLPSSIRVWRTLKYRSW